MGDIDLIPNAYRTWRWQARWMKFTAWLIAGLTATLLLTWTVLGLAIDSARKDIETLQNKLAETAQQQADIERLAADKVELERQLRLLSNLRRGVAAGDMFVTVDKALTSDDIWFRNWKFERAGITVGEELETVNNGYIMVVPEGADDLTSDELRIQTNMEIRGQALDHSALSSFVRRLFVQPGIDDIRIRRTSLIDRNRADTVDFELAVILNTDVRIE